MKTDQFHDNVLLFLYTLIHELISNVLYSIYSGQFNNWINNDNPKSKVRRKKNYFEIWGQAFFRGQILCQANFWSRAKNFEAKIEAKPTLRSGQANGARLGFIVCPQKIGRQSLILTFLVNRQEVIKICVLKRNKRYHIDITNSLFI